VARAHP